MQFSGDFKNKYPNLYNFTHLKINDEFIPYENKGYIVTYEFKDKIIKEIDKLIEDNKKKNFKLQKYEKDKIPIILAANSVFKERNNELEEENEIFKHTIIQDTEMLKKLGNYINETDNTKIWCVKSECDNKCYECVLQHFKEKQ